MSEFTLALCIQRLQQLPDGLDVEITRSFRHKHRGVWMVSLTAVEGTLIAKSMGTTIDEDPNVDTIYDEIWADDHNLADAILRVLELWDERKNTA